MHISHMYGAGFDVEPHRERACYYQCWFALRPMRVLIAGAVLLAWTATAQRATADAASMGRLLQEAQAASESGATQPAKCAQQAIRMVVADRAAADALTAQQWLWLSDLAKPLDQTERVLMGLRIQQRMRQSGLSGEEFLRLCLPLQRLLGREEGSLAMARMLEETEGWRQYDWKILAEVYRLYLQTNLPEVDRARQKLAPCVEQLVASGPQVLATLPASTLHGLGKITNHMSPSAKQSWLASMRGLYISGGRLIPEDAQEAFHALETLRMLGDRQAPALLGDYLCRCTSWHPWPAVLLQRVLRWTIYARSDEPRLIEGRRRVAVHLAQTAPLEDLRALLRDDQSYGNFTCWFVNSLPPGERMQLAARLWEQAVSAAEMDRIEEGQWRELAYCLDRLGAQQLRLLLARQRLDPIEMIWDEGGISGEAMAAATWQLGCWRAMAARPGHRLPVWQGTLGGRGSILADESDIAHVDALLAVICEDAGSLTSAQVLQDLRELSDDAGFNAMLQSRANQCVPPMHLTEAEPRLGSADRQARLIRGGARLLERDLQGGVPLWHQALQVGGDTSGLAHRMTCEALDACDSATTMAGLEALLGLGAQGQARAELLRQIAAMRFACNDLEGAVAALEQAYHAAGSASELSELVAFDRFIALCWAGQVTEAIRGLDDLAPTQLSAAGTASRSFLQGWGYLAQNDAASARASLQAGVDAYPAHRFSHRAAAIVQRVDELFAAGDADRLTMSFDDYAKRELIPHQDAAGQAAASWPAPRREAMGRRTSTMMAALAEASETIEREETLAVRGLLAELSGGQLRQRPRQPRTQDPLAIYHRYRGQMQTVELPGDADPVAREYASLVREGERYVQARAGLAAELAGQSAEVAAVLMEAAVLPALLDRTPAQFLAGLMQCPSWMAGQWERQQLSELLISGSSSRHWLAAEQARLGCQIPASDQVGLLGQRADALARDHNPQRALEALTVAYDLSVQEGVDDDAALVVAMKLAAIRTEQGNPREGAKLLNQCMVRHSVGSNWPRAAVQELTCLFEAGEYSALTSTVQKALGDPRYEPVTPQLLYLAWMANRRAEQAGKAQEYGQRLLRDYPKSDLCADVQLAGAIDAANAGRNSQARQMLSAVLRDYPGTTSAAKATELMQTISQ